MPLRARICCALLLALTAPALLPAGAVRSENAASVATAAVPDDSDVQKAITALRQDPLMGGTHRAQTLHWRKQEAEQPGKTPPWLERLLAWIFAAAQWLARNARALVIVAAVVGAAMLAIVIWRSWSPRGRRERAEQSAPPTHVGGLDIRPAELPDDVARAARSLWERGDRRGAMVLLYRALLSRLVHGYHTAIRDSSTEGDCLRQAARALPAAALAYVAQFVASWQRAMYAAIWPEPSDFERLCAGFEASLPVPPAGAPASSPPGAGA
jgi:hypothetical protein